MSVNLSSIEPSAKRARWPYYVVGGLLIFSLLYWAGRSDGEEPDQGFMDSELMARAGISETGLSVGQFVEIMSLIKRTNGKSLRIDRWVSDDNRYVAEVSGTPTAKMLFEQYRNLPSHPVVLRTVEVDDESVDPLTFVTSVLAAVQSQPDVGKEIQRRRQATGGAFGTERVERQAAEQKKLREEFQSEREARATAAKKRAQEARDARDAYLQAQREARSAK